MIAYILLTVAAAIIMDLIRRLVAVNRQVSELLQVSRDLMTVLHPKATIKEDPPKKKATINEKDPLASLPQDYDDFHERWESRSPPSVRLIRTVNKSKPAFEFISSKSDDCWDYDSDDEVS
tara:strand:+ start:124 stop:486 length:363 start_codon:yes stop_codon:yes gene_type:complete